MFTKHWFLSSGRKPPSLNCTNLHRKNYNGFCTCRLTSAMYCVFTIGWTPCTKYSPETLPKMMPARDISVFYSRARLGAPFIESRFGTVLENSRFEQKRTGLDPVCRFEFWSATEFCRFGIMVDLRRRLPESRFESPF